MTKLIQELRNEVSQGENWQKSVAKHIGLWNEKEEFYRGYKYIYLIDDEALDWLTLTERLVSSIKPYITKEEYNYVSTSGLLPDQEIYKYIKKTIPKKKLSQMRNFYYGIIIENLIYHYKILEYQKNTIVAEDNDHRFYEEIYNKPIEVLYEIFYKERKTINKNKLNFHELKLFSYWLFKYRLKHSDKTKMAHETNTALKLANITLDKRVLILFE
tara:strand:+ start:2173 stop:2817 length:645 start_codon:yes stop_codon:yes gene_type:complete